MNKLQELFFRKRLAYQQCFLDDKGNLTAAAKIVFADLAKFSGVAESIIVVSPVSRQTDVPATFQREGRREVFTRLWRMLRLPINQVFDNEDLRDE